jgi:hypothetical protein
VLFIGVIVYTMGQRLRHASRELAADSAG